MYKSCQLVNFDDFLWYIHLILYWQRTKAVVQLTQNNTKGKQKKIGVADLKDLQSSTDDWFPTLGEHGFLCTFPAPKTTLLNTGSGIIIII